MFASGGIVDNQAKKSSAAAGVNQVPESVSILTWTVLGIASGLFLLRLAIVVYRFKTRPSFQNKVDTNGHQDAALKH